MRSEPIDIAIDIGAGLGVKIGLFADPHHPIADDLFTRDQYGDDFETFAGQLMDRVRSMMDQHGLSMNQAAAVGICSPGLFRSDGSFVHVHNLPFLNGCNLKQWLAQETGLPTAIANDADAGGLAEWSVMKTDLLYWVFGGGWGGSWINQDGEVQFPSLDWNGDDATLHYTNEPGYAIPLDKMKLKSLFHKFGALYERFEQIIVEDLQIDCGKLTGPCGNEDTIRAETILSGPGRCQLFRTVVGDDNFYQRFLDIKETDQMSDPSVAGKHISKLSGMRVEAAVNTDRLFGAVLAMATDILVKQARGDGLPDGIAICLGGKPSYALPYFGPSAQSRIGAAGIMSYLRPSIIDQRGMNANLVGAAVLAQKQH